MKRIVCIADVPDRVDLKGTALYRKGAMDKPETFQIALRNPSGQHHDEIRILYDRKGCKQRGNNRLNGSFVAFKVQGVIHQISVRAIG